MSNSWCKVENGQIIEGPRAWENNTPPDATWVPHRLVDPSHTINDNFDGSVFEVVGNEVIETNQYSAKPQEQIDDEVVSIKNRANQSIAKADEKLADPTVTNKEDWQAYKNAWALLTNITQLSWDYVMPSEPQE